MNPKNHTAPASQGRRENPGRRIFVLKLGFLLFFLVIVLRLVQIQLVEAPHYQEKARRQHEARETLPALRGNIYDRNYTLLVSNSRTVSFGADPKMLGANAAAVAGRFAAAFDRPRSAYLAKMTDSDRRFVWLERRVKPEYSKRVNTPAVSGVVEIPEPRRLYHYEHIASQLIGFTDVDNNGLDGLELQLDEQLKGKNGYVILAKDAIGRKRVSMEYPRVEPVGGKSAVLTLDVDFQLVVEEELRKGVEATGAESGLAVMLDPTTGEVLAMANFPAVNPNDVAQSDAAQRRNRVVTDMFEPGSVFKVVTAAAALEGRKARLDEKFNAEHGRYLVTLPNGMKRPITDTHEYGTLTFQQAMEVSSNIVMAKVSDRIGAEALYTMSRNFGFGVRSGIELSAEAGGVLKKPSEWSGTTLNSMAFGYEVGVTPLQIAAAYAAVANRGVLMKPYVVREIVDEGNEVLFHAEPQKVRDVISKETAATLTRLFEGVVERGTGVAARVNGLRIAGKTGTSWKWAEGDYQKDKSTASFAGYFPADDPKAVCLVMLDNPHRTGSTGGTASAPIFKAIAQRVYAMSRRFTRSSPEGIAGSQRVAVPDVVNLRVDAAKSTLSARGLQCKIHGKGETILGQTPAPGTVLAPGTMITLATSNGNGLLQAGYTIVPDLRGLSLRRALNSLVTSQLDVSISGSGVVAAQNPAAGQPVRIGTRVTVRCEPRNLAAG